MNIAFLINRNVFYKYFGSLIDESLKRGHRVICLHDFSQPREGQKGYQFPKIEDVPEFKYGSVTCLSFKSDEDVKKIVREKDIDVMVTLHFLPQYLNLKKILDIPFVSVQHGLDTVDVARYFDVPDLYLLYSDFWADLSMKYLKREKPFKKIKSVGFFEIDQEEMVRDNFDIPKGKKVVLLLPFPFSSTSDRFWAPFIYGMNNLFLQLPFALFKKRYLKQVLNRENDKNVVKAIKEFCVRNDAFLLVKARRKDPVRKYVKKVADKIIYDEDFYPATIIKALKASDLVFNFYSTTVTESSFMGVPNVCISPSEKDYSNVRGVIWQIVLKNKDLFDFHGVSYKKTIKEIIKELPNSTFASFPFVKEEGEKYLDKYIGHKGASEKALIEIEKLKKIV